MLEPILRDSWLTVWPGAEHRARFRLETSLLLTLVCVLSLVLLLLLSEQIVYYRLATSNE